jgi:hypothetical protein
MAFDIAEVKNDFLHFESHAACLGSGKTNNTVNTLYFFPFAHISDVPLKYAVYSETSNAGLSSSCPEPGMNWVLRLVSPSVRFISSG